MPSSGGQTCARSEEHTSELQSLSNLVCRLLLEKNEGSEKKLQYPPLLLVNRNPAFSFVSLLAFKIPRLWITFIIPQFDTTCTLSQQPYYGRQCNSSQSFSSLPLKRLSLLPSCLQSALPWKIPHN